MNPIKNTEQTKKILVLCTGNSCRSQIAEGYLRHYGQSKLLVYSAGVEVHGVNPLAIAAMRRDNIDISHHTSNHVDDYKGMEFDFIITVCDNAKEHCPFFPGRAVRVHRNFPDPAKAAGDEKAVEPEFDRVRDMIRQFCRDFIQENIH
jgi:arsenate reductase